MYSESKQIMEEQFDVLDESGNKTGQVLPKSEVHNSELWHGAAFIWIYNPNGEVLLQFRSADKKLYASVWDVSVGGHMSAGDKPEQTAIREAEEELGLKISPEELVYIGKCRDEDRMINGKTHREHDWVFLMPADVAKEQLKLQKSEVTKAKWLAIDQLEEAISKPDWKKYYAGRNRYIYETAIAEIRKRLNK